MGGGSSQVTGYKYYLGVHFALSHGPVDALTNILVDSRAVWSGNVADGPLYINNPNIFGGEDREGGIQGSVDFCNGGPNQMQNSYLSRVIGGGGSSGYSPPPDGIEYFAGADGIRVVQTVNGTTTDSWNSSTSDNTVIKITLPDGSTTTTTTTFSASGPSTTVTTTPAVPYDQTELIPAFRGVACVVLRQVYMGTNPYMKRWQFRIRRIHVRSNNQPQWYDEKSQIGIDMNPAHVIHECLTDNEWGMGYLEADVDDVSFRSVADKLYLENFGLSILWDKEATIEDFIAEVLKHIDGSLYVDRTTGLFKLRLIRDDFDKNTIPLFDENNVVSVEEYACPTFTELINSVTVNYWDSTYGVTGSVTVQDPALVQLQGSTVSTTNSYGGVSNSALATRLASRDLRAVSTPITRCAIYTNRDGAKLVPGDPIRLSWPEYGMSEMVMRVVIAELGSAVENTVKVTLMQDVFALGASSYMAPPASVWVNPVSAPIQVTYRKFLEAPYYLLVQKLTQQTVDANLATVSGLGYAVAGGVRPSGDSLFAKTFADDGSGYKDSGRLNFCPTALAAITIGKTDTSCNLSRAVDLDVGLVTPGSLAMIDDEIICVVEVSEDSLTFKRGCLDTVPANHPAGSRFFFMQTMNRLVPTEFVSGESVNFKLQTVTGMGTLPLANTPENAINFNNRAARPYPPAQFQISGQYFPSSLNDVPITASWCGRNRLTQTGSSVVGFIDGNIAPEDGTQYEIRLYNNNTGVLIYSNSTSGNSDTNIPTLTGTLTLRMELWSTRGSLSSLYKQSHVFNYKNIAYLNTEDMIRLITEDGDVLISE